MSHAYKIPDIVLRYFNDFGSLTLWRITSKWLNLKQYS